MTRKPLIRICHDGEWHCALPGCNGWYGDTPIEAFRRWQHWMEPRGLL